MERKVLDLVTEIVEQGYEERPHYQGMSQSGKCVRQLWLKARGFGTRPVAASITTFEDGHTHEEKVIEHLKTKYTVYDRKTDHEGNVLFWNEQWELASEDPVFDGNYRGHIDGIIEINVGGELEGDWGFYILEVKSRNVDRFKEVVKNGVRVSHWSAYLQIQAYLHHASQLPFPIRGCYYVAKAKQDPKQLDTPYYGEVIDYDPVVADWVMTFESMKRMMLTNDETIPAVLELKDSPAEFMAIGMLNRRYYPLCAARYCNVRDTCFQYGEGAEDFRG